MLQYFGFGELTAQPAGAYSWQHLTFVTTLVLIMAALAVVIGIYYRNHPEKNKNIPLIWAAILIDGIEIVKIVLGCIHADNPIDSIMHNLPLFLCSIQLITLPLAAFSTGRLKQAALDFVLIFGLLGALTGTYGAAQNYNAYPIFYYVNVASGLTHCISGFGSLYIAISGMTSMKKKNIGITFSILGVCWQSPPRQPHRYPGSPSCRCRRPCKPSTDTSDRCPSADTARRDPLRQTDARHH